MEVYVTNPLLRHVRIPSRKERECVLRQAQDGRFEAGVGTTTDLEALKAAAATRALQLVQPGMVIGLGTGSTVRYFIEGLARLLESGMTAKGVPTSVATAELAKSLALPIVDDLTAPIDLAVDGADEIDPDLRLIKGRGGALTREKLVASAARRFVVIADGSKLVGQLGRGVLPVEVIPFLWRRTAEQLEALGASYALRGDPGQPFITDNGNLILDLTFAAGIEDPEVLDAQLNQTVGVVEHGLFIDLADTCIVADASGVRVLGSLG